MSKTITFANHKGGVAKSQSAIELGAFLAAQGAKVLQIDADPQANSSDLLLAGNKMTGRSLPDILLAGDAIRSEDVMTRTFPSGCSVDYLCSSILAARIESRILSSPKEYVMADALKEICSRYDFVIIDTPPSAELLGLSVLIASDEVIIPVTPDKYSIDGVNSLMKTIDAVRANSRLNPNLMVRGILVTRFRAAISTLKGIRQLKQLYGDLVIETPIRECTRVQQAVASSLPVQDYDPSCNAAKDYVKAFTSLFNLE